MGKEVMRYDSVQIGARFDEDGFLHDTPILTRVGVFNYTNPDGSIRREFRPPDEVLKQDSLETYRGKPIMLLHPAGQIVTGVSAKGSIIGTMLTEGRGDGENVVADITIHDKSALDTGFRELSLGYRARIDETPGIWRGQKYDVVQRDIKINHAALVPKGRAGNAALRLDADDNQIFENEEDKGNMDNSNLQTLRLDSGLSYQVSPEVAVAFAEMQKKNDSLTQEKTDLLAAKDKAEGERDGLKSELEKIKTDSASDEKNRNDAFEQQVQQRINLLATAQKAGVVKTDGFNNRELKEATIKAIRGDNIDFDGKSEDYVQGLFDAAVASLDDMAINSQRQMSSRSDSDDKVKTVDLAQSRLDMIDNMKKAWEGEEK